MAKNSQGRKLRKDLKKILPRKQRKDPRIIRELFEHTIHKPKKKREGVRETFSHTGPERLSAATPYQQQRIAERKAAMERDQEVLNAFAEYHGVQAPLLGESSKLETVAERLWMSLEPELTIVGPKGVPYWVGARKYAPIWELSDFGSKFDVHGWAPAEDAYFWVGEIGDKVAMIWLGGRPLEKKDAIKEMLKQLKMESRVPVTCRFFHPSCAQVQGISRMMSLRNLEHMTDAIGTGGVYSHQSLYILLDEMQMAERTDFGAVSSALGPADSGAYGIEISVAHTQPGVVMVPTSKVDQEVKGVDTDLETYVATHPDSLLGVRYIPRHILRSHDSGWGMHSSRRNHDPFRNIL